MSNLKDTDLDDLFQRASDKYPLRTDSANWDRMAAALEKEPPPPDAVDAEEKRKKRRFFWLFLLLPLAGAGYFAWHRAGHVNPARTGVITNAATPMTVASPSANANSTSTAKADVPVTATANRPVTATTHGPATATTNAPTPATADVNRPTTHARSARATSGHANTTKPAGDKTFGDASMGGASTTVTTGGSPLRGGTIQGGISQGGTTHGGASQGATAQNATNLGSTPVDEDRLFYDLQRAPIPRNYRLDVNVTAPATAKKDTTTPTSRTKHFYAGVMGAPDLSTVKMQSVKGVGSTFGVVLGYTFNGGRWAIETGAYVDRKKYYTDGEYFNTKEVHLPANSWLTDVNGVCYMWELPLNVRYNFNPGAKTAWFATAGFSTYLMSSEKYQYGLEWTGSNGVYDSSWNIHKPSQYPFSIINLSLGFEQRLGKIGNLRVEPYVRLPLTGFGTGKLPIMSTGVNIGITRQLW